MTVEPTVGFVPTLAASPTMNGMLIDWYIYHKLSLTTILAPHFCGPISCRITNIILLFLVHPYGLFYKERHLHVIIHND